MFGMDNRWKRVWAEREKGCGSTGEKTQGWPSKNVSPARLPIHPLRFPHPTLVFLPEKREAHALFHFIHTPCCYYKFI